MISQDKIIEIRDRASIVEVISDYVTLKKTGRNHTGLCPFHSEKTPSFTVNEEKGIFHCFGCQTGGSIFQFLMQYDHLTFPEAVERVAKRYGITIGRQSGQAHRMKWAKGNPCIASMSGSQPITRACFIAIQREKRRWII